DVAHAVGSRPAALAAVPVRGRGGPPARSAGRLHLQAEVRGQSVQLDPYRAVHCGRPPCVLVHREYQQDAGARGGTGIHLPDTPVCISSAYTQSSSSVTRLLSNSPRSSGERTAVRPLIGTSERSRSSTCSRANRLSSSHRARPARNGGGSWPGQAAISAAGRVTSAAGRRNPRIATSRRSVTASYTSSGASPAPRRLKYTSSAFGAT